MRPYGQELIFIPALVKVERFPKQYISPIQHDRQNSRIARR